MKEAIDIGLTEFSAESPSEKVQLSHQRRMAEAFLEFKGSGDNEEILDVQLASSARPGKAVHTLSSLTGRLSDKITPCEVAADGGGNWHASAGGYALSENGQRLPYSDGEFEWVFCNALLEHVGNARQQQALLNELWRVARKGVFVTAANRKHPIEFNTGLPLLHWMPRSMWSGLLNLLGREKWKKNGLPNLVDAATLKSMAALLPGHASYDVGHVRMAGIKAQLFLMISKPAIAPEK